MTAASQILLSFYFQYDRNRNSSTNCVYSECAHTNDLLHSGNNLDNILALNVKCNNVITFKQILEA